MRKLKKILASLAMIAIVSSTTVGATKAYFSDDGTSYNNTFSTGILDLQLADGDEGWSNNVNGTWSSPANWKPGDEVKTSIYLRNVGTVPAEAVYAYWHNLQGNTGVANFIEVTWLSDSTGIGTNSIGPFVTAYDANGDTKLSLAELVNGLSHYNGPSTPDPFQARFYADFEETYIHPVLPYNGGVFEILLGYKFMESAGNDLQGQSVSFDLTLQAAQHHYTP